MRVIDMPAYTAKGLPIGTTVRAVGEKTTLTGVITWISEENGVRRVKISHGPIGTGRSNATNFDESKTTFEVVTPLAKGAVLIINRVMERLTGICYDFKDARDWVVANTSDENDYALVAR